MREPIRFRAILWCAAVCTATLSPITARAQATDPFTFYLEDGTTKVADIKVGSVHLVPAVPGHSIRVQIDDGAAAVTYGGYGGTAACPKSPCQITLPSTAAVIQDYHITRASEGTAVVTLPPFFVLSFAGLAAAALPGSSTLRATLPGGLGSIDLSVSDSGGIPQVTATTVPTVPASPINLTGIISGTTQSLTGTAQLTGGSVAIAFTASPTALSGRSTGPANLTVGVATATVESLQLTSTATGITAIGTVSFNEPALGTLRTENTKFTSNGPAFSFDPGASQWSSPAATARFGRMLLGFSKATVTYDPANSAFRVVVQRPSLGSDSCGTATIRDLQFANGALIGDDSMPGSTLSITESLSIPLRDACVSATKVTMSLGAAPKRFKATFNADLTANWLGAGHLSAAGLGISWTDPDSFAVTNPSNFEYAGKVLLDGVAIENVKGALAADGALALSATLGGAQIAADLDRSGLTANFTGSRLTLLGFTYDAGEGSVTLKNVPSTQDPSLLRLRKAQVSIPLPAADGKDLILQIEPDTGKTYAIATQWDGTKWRWDAAAAFPHITTQFQTKPIVTLGPLNFTLEPYLGVDLRPEFTGCGTSALTFSGNGSTTPELTLCGTLRIADQGTAGVVRDFCTRVGANYQPFDKTFAFGVLQNPPKDPKAPVIDPACMNGFNFAQLLRAQFETFHVAYESGNAKSFALDAQVLVRPTGGIPGINSSLFDSALLTFTFDSEKVGMVGSISSLEAFSVPNVVNYKITSLDVIATHTFKGSDTVIVLNAGDSTATLPGVLGITVYGKGGGLEYHNGGWKTHFPGVRLRETVLSFLGQLVTSGSIYNFAKNGTRGLKL